MYREETIPNKNVLNNFTFIDLLLLHMRIFIVFCTCMYKTQHSLFKIL